MELHQSQSDTNSDKSSDTNEGVVLEDCGSEGEGKMAAAASGASEGDETREERIDDHVKDDDVSKGSVKVKTEEVEVEVEDAESWTVEYDDGSKAVLIREDLR